MVKLIATDMDRTLLNSSRAIDSEFYDVLDKLKKQNIIMAFASGRNLQSLQRLIPKEYIDDIMFISNNGSYVIYKGNELFLKTISIDDIKNIDNCLSCFKNIRCIVCTTDKIYTNSIKNFFIGRMRGYKQIYTKNFSKITGKPIKYTLFSNENDQKDILDALSLLEDELSIVPSGKGTIDITAKDINKGVAIKYIQDKLSITYDETAVFGDYLNDMEMMDSAYFSFAMENAHPKLKEKASFLAPHHNNKGVIRTIEILLNNNNTYKENFSK